MAIVFILHNLCIVINDSRYVASIQQDFSEDPPYSPPDSGFKVRNLRKNNKTSEAHHNVLKWCQNKNLMVAFQPSQPVEAPSLGYGAPLADPLTVYTSPNQVGFRLLMPLLMSLQANLDLSND